MSKISANRLFLLSLLLVSCNYVFASGASDAASTTSTQNQPDSGYTQPVGNQDSDPDYVFDQDEGDEGIHDENYDDNNDPSDTSSDTDTLSYNDTEELSHDYLD